MLKGLIQIYIGNGKGKTTAAIGQGVRAVGRGLKVIMIQFFKGQKSGEIQVLQKLDKNYQVLRFNSQAKFVLQMDEKEKQLLFEESGQGLKKAAKIIENNTCDLLILDEISCLLNEKIVTTDRIIQLLKKKPRTMEIILTGRDMSQDLINLADLVTEMKDIKHPFNRGIKARQGIDL